MANLDNAKEIGFGVVSANNISTHAPQQITYSSTPPSSPSNGEMWFDTADLSFKFYDGGSWQIIKQAPQRRRHGTANNRANGFHL